MIGWLSDTGRGLTEPEGRSAQTLSDEKRRACLPMADIERCGDQRLCFAEKCVLPGNFFSGRFVKKHKTSSGRKRDAFRISGRTISGSFDRNDRNMRNRENLLVFWGILCYNTKYERCGSSRSRVRFFCVIIALFNVCSYFFDLEKKELFSNSRLTFRTAAYAFAVGGAEADIQEL